ncbi:RagB/SusD family nutrient uptake outer membrane protein [Muricauda sp. JGD-17]|uniref:RagB/SusD family nutrient uptake outer membrane protein n=1 Tax=Flagellimonas ochracea TaxID=2696472 RepID=A0A964WXQ7_9FLAO|nr:RagB/SusD family nutrient uptake outer membrane protein [Allomuricauda ochracea]NAY92063.1 RagB/SusD family nutrient uptake outer membrane protein [Allomuricauda ochracea]
MKRNQFKLLSIVASSAMLMFSCTNLEIEETDSIIPEDTGTGFTGVTEPASQVTDLYNNVWGFLGNQENLYAMSEVTTDEHLVPTRGTDWGDNGIWRVLHTHTWDFSHLFILRTWNDYNQTIFRASEVIDSRSNADALTLAEAKFIRAWATWVILDNFGQVPFRGVDEGPEINPSVLTRTEAVALVIADLEEAIPSLPSVAAGTGDLKRASAQAAKFLLARVLLNNHIYNGSGTPDSADMNRVIALVDEIAADGYELQAGYFDIFRDSADSETIWWAQTAVGNNIFNGLHYNSTGISGGGWNGFSTLAEFYDLFEGDPNSNRGEVDGTPLDGQEERRGWVPSVGTPFTGADGTTDNGGFEDGSNVGLGFLIGQQYALDGTPLKDRPGNPLVFEKEFASLIGNNERTGIRVQKYAARYGAFNSHKVIFRYADAHLMKAEAIMRTGGDPTSMVNELRTIRGAAPLGTVGEQQLLDERGRELYTEFVRRTDMIRFGQFTSDWALKEVSGDETKNIFPIPQTALLSNPNLQQNPGY